MNFSQLRALAVSAGFPNNEDADTAAAIALAESGGNPAAVGDNGTSFGLWQVHTPAWPQFDSTSLLDPTYNANAAFTIYKAIGGFTPWSTYTTSDPSISYLRYMPTFSTAKTMKVVKVVALVAAASIVISEVIRHGGVTGTVRALQRAV